MTKLTVNTDTPSEQIVKAAMAEVTVHDVAGRPIMLRKPGALAQFRLMEAVGGTNPGYIAMCMPLIYVASVAGVPVSAIRTKAEVEALVQNLDEDGLIAVSEGVEKHFPPADPEKDRTALKK
ncbi:hypothetical protein LV28_24770 [Pandoraea pnomenusa]|uniref:Phage tail assembly protein n=1 Tax=Pandoraea pnomenusa TaxID=93220 RepID=A0A378YXX5_9BURK|nr:hypothetical protein LV28_24770 [Pandoraea pnomenusa]SUA82006.1 Uncharacterised protein [Pandoraea pnomenusa]